jgi:crotonobetainyl-CoA:carnitine CoA-transferase CaiB-like acyl-CoA transferase
MSGFEGLVVVDGSSSIAGAYCAKLFADAGATVTLVEPASGAPLRRWSWDRELEPGQDGALFRYLRHGQRSVTDPTAVEQHLESADLVILSGLDPLRDPRRLAEERPDLVVLSITPYGLEGPYAGRAGTDFVVQADSGALAIRGTTDRPPMQMGGRIAEWVAGAYAGVAAAASCWRQAATGSGDLIDLSLCEVANLTGSNFADLSAHLAGRPALTGPARTVELPSVEPTLDGWVGFNTNTRDQFDSFCLLIERPDLHETDWWRLPVRQEKAAEWIEIVRAWTTLHPTAEIVELAALLRIPVAPVQDGRSVLDLAEATGRELFQRDPLDEFSFPRRAWQIHGEPYPPVRPAPHIGQNDGEPAPARRDRPGVPVQRQAPLHGIRVLDLTAWWAGPTATGVLAALGAEVVHVESIARMDGMRTAAGAFHEREQWWEYSAFFLSANANKHGITLDLNKEKGRELALRLVKEADVVVENFTPRVLEAFGLSWEELSAVNPRLVMVRMPAFGLDGKWRNRPGFAQTMEQISGMAWLTGFPDDQPRIQRGPCDPNGGMHAAFAAITGLSRRERTGVGGLVEAPMIEAALAVGAEPVLEWSAYGNLIGRDGNRGPDAAPQGLYPCAGTEQWLALSVATDQQWQALSKVIGQPELSADPDLADLAGRRRHHDRLDAVIEQWAAPLDLAAAVDALVAEGIPAAPATDPRRTSDHAQLVARGFYEAVEHPVVGTHPTAGLPWRATDVDHWIVRPAPTVGQANHQVLTEWIGCSDDELAELAAQGVIGDRPLGV